MKKLLFTFIMLTLVSLANAEWNSMEKSQISGCKNRKLHITYTGDLKDTPVFFSSNVEETMEGVFCPEKAKTISIDLDGHNYARYCNLVLSKKLEKNTCEYFCPTSIADVHLICTLNN